MILVTGGTGMVGTHLLMDLMKGDKPIRAIYRSEKSLKKAKRVFELYCIDWEEISRKIEWVQSDLLNPEVLQCAFDGVEYVYHCAAMVSFNKKDKQKLLKVNIEGTANVVNLCLSQSVKKLCHVSSTAAIGKTVHDEMRDEECNWVNDGSFSNYSISKYFSEMEVWRGIEEGLNAVIVCPAIILGPGKWEKGSSMLFKQVWKGLSFYTSGTNGFVDVRDVVNVMIQLMKGKIKSERFILCSESIPFKKTFDFIAEALGKKKPKIKVGPFLSAFGWRIAKIISIISGKPPLITKEIVLAGNSISIYENKKIKTTLNYQFKSVEQSCKDFSTIFIHEHKVD